LEKLDLGQVLLSKAKALVAIIKIGKLMLVI
jgi:hypothetical protein